MQQTNTYNQFNKQCVTKKKSEAMNGKNNKHFNRYLYNTNIFRNVSQYLLILYEYIVTTIPHIIHNCA